MTRQSQLWESSLSWDCLCAVTFDAYHLSGSFPKMGTKKRHRFLYLWRPCGATEKGYHWRKRYPCSVNLFSFNCRIACCCPQSLDFTGFLLPSLSKPCIFKALRALKYSFYLFPLDKFLYLELYFQFISRQLAHIFSDFLSTISVYRIS